MSKACFLNLRLTHRLSLSKAREQEGAPQRVLAGRTHSWRQGFMPAADTEEGWAHKRLCSVWMSLYNEWEITVLAREGRGKTNPLTTCGRGGSGVSQIRRWEKQSSLPFSCSIHRLGEKYAHICTVYLYMYSMYIHVVCVHTYSVSIACMCMDGCLDVLTIVTG